VPQGRAELVALEGDLVQAHVPDAGGGQNRPAMRPVDLQRLLVGGGRGVQPALGPLHLAQVLVSPRDIGGRAAHPPPADCRRQRVLGICKPAAQPLGPG
jgi:hypothetical protein